MLIENINTAGYANVFSYTVLIMERQYFWALRFTEPPTVFIFRLIDNEQFLFGQSLKARESFRDRISTAAKKFYLTKYSITIC